MIVVPICFAVMTLLLYRALGSLRDAQANPNRNELPPAALPPHVPNREKDPPCANSPVPCSSRSMA